MSNLEQLILKLKETTKRDNYFFLRRRIEKGNGKKTLGWILKKENSDKTTENIDFTILNEMKTSL